MISIAQLRFIRLFMLYAFVVTDWNMLERAIACLKCWWQRKKPELRQKSSSSNVNQTIQERCGCLLVKAGTYVLCTILHWCEHSVDLVRNVPLYNETGTTSVYSRLGLVMHRNRIYTNNAKTSKKLCCLCVVACI